MINKELLQNKLTALKIPGAVTDIKQNAFYTDIYISFSPDITYNKIKARQKDLEIYFDSNISFDHQGGQIILKIQNKSRNYCSIFSFSDDIIKGRTGCNLPLIIGENENGKKLYIDLTKTPHLLIGGATGSGKSCFINNCILSHIFRGGDSSLLLIDLKKVEFSIYENIPQLASPVCYDSKTAVNLLKNLCFEMDRRYTMLKTAGYRNISEYHASGGKMNYYTLIIDELADLVLSDKRIEPYLIRLAQLGRAAGIHLILATQRPDSVVLSGLIRANIPSRVCFAVQKATDSRIILDTAGGERLQGAGDGLLKLAGDPSVIRFQAPYIDTVKTRQIVQMARAVKVRN